MTPSDIKLHLRLDDFRPVRVHASDGRSFDITDRALVYLDGRSIYIGVGELVDGIPSKTIYVDTHHITSIEPLQGYSGPPNGNGQGSPRNRP